MKKLYHLTPQRNLKNILRKGLLPTKSQSSLAAIFLTDDVFTARNYQGMKEAETWVLLSIPLAVLNPQHLGPDNYELADYLSSHPNSPYQHWSDASWEYSLAKVHQIAYYEIIPPEFITVEDTYQN